MNAIIYQIKDALEYLLTHNKNYTQVQYFKLLDIDDYIRLLEKENEK